MNKNLIVFLTVFIILIISSHNNYKVLSYTQLKENKAKLKIKSDEKNDSLRFRFSFIVRNMMSIKYNEFADSVVYQVQKDLCKGILVKTDTFFNDLEGEITKIACFKFPESCEIVDSVPAIIPSEQIKNFSKIELKSIVDSSTIQNIDSICRTSVELKNLLKRNGGLDYPIDELIGTLMPQIGQFVFKKDSVYIVTYKTTWDTTGPRLILINNTVYPLTGQCSFEKLKIYTINERYLIETGSNCCECGIIGSEIYEITQDGPVLIYSDYSWSN